MSARFWFVMVDDTPENPSSPYSEDGLYEAYDRLREWLRQDPNAKVELRQCDEDDLVWAGINPETGERS